MKTLGECLPKLVDELAFLLQQEGESELAKLVAALPLLDRCRCGDDFCATLYTASGADRGRGFRRTIALHPEAGDINLDIGDEGIACIEILCRPEIREEVLRLLP